MVSASNPHRHRRFGYLVNKIGIGMLVLHVAFTFYYSYNDLQVINLEYMLASIIPIYII